MVGYQSNSLRQIRRKLNDLGGFYCTDQEAKNATPGRVDGSSEGLTACKTSLVPKNVNPWVLAMSRVLRMTTLSNLRTALKIAAVARTKTIQGLVQNATKKTQLQLRGAVSNDKSTGNNNNAVKLADSPVQNATNKTSLHRASDGDASPLV